MRCPSILKNLSVLLVEDEQNLAHLLQSAIGNSFKDFILAYDGEEGLQKALTLQPDIVITDITMPKMNGLEMSARLHEDHPDLPIVILSAYSEKDYLLEAIEIGVSKYLIKPFDPDELLETLCSLARETGKANYLPLMPPFRFNPQNKKLFRENIMLRLSRRENLFIDHLLASPNYFLPSETIKSVLWEEDTISDERLRVFINRLRQKTHPDLIENIVGQGYLLRTEAPEKSAS